MTDCTSTSGKKIIKNNKKIPPPPQLQAPQSLRHQKTKPNKLPTTTTTNTTKEIIKTSQLSTHCRFQGKLLNSHSYPGSLSIRAARKCCLHNCKFRLSPLNGEQMEACVRSAVLSSQMTCLKKGFVVQYRVKILDLSLK